LNNKKKKEKIIFEI